MGMLATVINSLALQNSIEKLGVPTRVLTAIEINADVVIKATKVDGIYDKDPVKYSDAVKYETVTYSEVLNKDLKVMDAAAISLCRDNKLPLIVFNSLVEGNIKKVVLGECNCIGTKVI